jgi:hypothetical protein
MFGSEFYAGSDVPALAVDREACTPLIDDACKPVDNPCSDTTLLVMRLVSTSLIDSLAVLNSSNIHARKEI